MSYGVYVFPRAFEAAFTASKSDDFLEDEANRIPFSAETRATLLRELERSGWKVGKEVKFGLELSNEAVGAEALLTTSSLYMRGSGTDAIFDISMFASEIAGEELAKYDPQTGAWE